MSEQQHPTSATDIQPRQGYVEVEARMDLLDQEGDAAWQLMQDAYEACDDETKRKLDQWQDDIKVATDEADAKDEALPSVAAFMEGHDYIPDGFRAGVLAYGEYIDKSTAVEKELETHAPEKAKDILRVAAELEGSLDYDVVVAMMSETDTYDLRYKVGFVIGVRKLLESGLVPTYHKLDSIDCAISKYAAEWQGNGVLRAEGTEPHAAEISDEEARSVVEQAAALEAHITDVSDLLVRYKKHDQDFFDKAHGVLHFIAGLGKAEDGELTLDDLFYHNKMAVNDAMNAAFGRSIARQLGELPDSEIVTDTGSEKYIALLETARQIDAAKAVKAIEVTGSFGELPFRFDESDLKGLLLLYVPAIALAGVKKVEFRPLTKEEDELDNINGFHRYSKELGGSIIVISDKQVKQFYQQLVEVFEGREDAEERARLIAENSMRQTIIHEFGHALHYALPVAALKRWEEQRASDPTNVTAYVKEHHDKDSHQRYKEDFADSMKLFIMKPEVLALISPARFDALRQIFEEFMPVYPEVIKKIQDSRIIVNKAVRRATGIDDEEARRIYLDHETAA